MTDAIPYALGRVHEGDCLDLMAAMPEASVDAVLTDCPYELGFMGRSWDRQGVSFRPDTWAAVMRVAKPGAHMLFFGGSRTYHRIACAVEDAGWELRDTIMWVYAQGFPKSLAVGKAIDKAKGAKRERIGRYASHRPNPHDDGKYNGNLHTNGMMTTSATPEAAKWEGWATALKPAYEAIGVARKPLEDTVVANVLKHGTGAMNIDGCRIAAEQPWIRETGADPVSRMGKCYAQDNWTKTEMSRGANREGSNLGRYPANLIHDGSPEVLAGFPDVGVSTGGSGEAAMQRQTDRTVGWMTGPCANMGGLGDSGSAARFFYTAKARTDERGHGNDHPTVKPLALMTYLVRLVTPPDGLILDPFAGSGTTGVAAVIEGFRFLGFDLLAHNCEIANRRIGEAVRGVPPGDAKPGVPSLFGDDK